MERFSHALSVGQLAEASPNVLASIHSKLVVGAIGDQQYQNQIQAWLVQLDHLQKTAQRLVEELGVARDWFLLFEYTIPYRGRRPDVVLLTPTSVFILEFKVGATGFGSEEKWQVRNYALDLRDFHLESRARAIHPFLVATKVAGGPIDTIVEGVTISCLGTDHLAPEILRLFDGTNGPVDWEKWANSAYSPSPSIVEAADSLYHNHDVTAINHNQADNLTKTVDAVQEIIRRSEVQRKRSICFVTGVPGAGKTLVGLAAVHDAKMRTSGNPKGIFLSGNSPLVAVIREAISRSTPKMHRKEARRTIQTFVENVHRFIDETVSPSVIPHSHAIVFDEAQRAWSVERMKQKGRVPKSEPDLLLDIMSRAEDWSVVIALVGGGQEINDGEAGLEEWGQALANRSDHWEVFVSPAVLRGDVSVAGHRLFAGPRPSNHAWHELPELHLSVGLRAPRASGLARWVEAVLAGDAKQAREIMATIREFPVVISRSMAETRTWLRGHTDSQQRSGLVASSGNRRLRVEGVQLSTRQGQNNDVENWFLAPATDVRSSNALEVAAIEFECQGLEIDWVGVCWGHDVTWQNDHWQVQTFAGTKWRKANEHDQRYRMNTYRVLLTRARQGLALFIPEGSNEDPTRSPRALQATYDFLLACGASPIVLEV